MEAIERLRGSLAGWDPCPCSQLFVTTHHTAGTDEVRHRLNEECEVCHKVNGVEPAMFEKQRELKAAPSELSSLSPGNFAPTVDLDLAFDGYRLLSGSK